MPFTLTMVSSISGRLYTTERQMAVETEREREGEGEKACMYNCQFCVL
jgi:hypothetical protein